VGYKRVGELLRGWGGWVCELSVLVSEWVGRVIELVGG
jgi:hypothetical protein